VSKPNKKPPKAAVMETKNAYLLEDIEYFGSNALLN
jgi:hypothetical protein